MSLERERLKDIVKSFATDYGRQFNLDRLAAQKALESGVEIAVK